MMNARTITVCHLSKYILLFNLFFKLIQLVVFNNTLSQAKTKRLVELDIQKSLVLITLILHFVL